MNSSNLGLRLLLGGAERRKAVAQITAAWKSAGSVTAAASLLGVSARTLTRWLDRFPELAAVDKATRAVNASDGRRGKRAA